MIMTIISILGCLFAAYLFYSDYMIAGIFMLLVSWLGWSFSND